MNFKKLTAMAVSTAMLMSCTAFAADDDSAVRTITYEEAVSMAIDNTSGIATLDESMDYMEKSKESVYTSLEGFIPVSGTSYTVEASIGTLLQSIGSLDGSSKTARYQKEMHEGTTELMIRNYFNTIKTSEQSLELAKESLALKQQEYNEMVIKNDLGMVSDNELNTTRNEITTLQGNVNSAELAIENVYKSLANAMGLNENTEFVIDYNIEYTPLQMDIPLENYITQKGASDPSVLAAKASLEQAEFNKKVSTYETEPYSYLEKENAVNQASRTYGDTVDALKTSIQNGYNSIMQLESNQTVLEAALDDVETAYATAQTNYNVGNITSLTLAQAELAVNQAETNLKSNASQHDLLVFQFQHPYMLSGASSGSSSGQSSSQAQ